MVYKFSPTYLCDLFLASVAERTHYPMRSASSHARAPFTRLALFEKSFVLDTTRLWNRLLTEKRLISDQSRAFKHAMLSKVDKYQGQLSVC